MLVELRILGRTIASMTNENMTDVYFASFSGAGHSGPTTVHHFRTAIGRNYDNYDDQFVESATEKLTEMQVLGSTAPPSRTVVFLDEYIGTGSSVIEDWGSIQGLTNDTDRYIYLALVGTETGISNISANVPNLEVVCGRTIADSEKIFHPNCHTFTEEEKAILLTYCKRADRWPTGFGDMQSLTVFYQRAPNNVIGILRGEKDGWIPLFPRFFQ